MQRLYIYTRKHNLKNAYFSMMGGVKRRCRGHGGW